MDGIFFQSGSTLLRTLIVGVLAYASLIVFLRVSGNRTLSKMNAFDFVVTVALGSTLATILLDQNVALAQGALALALLVALQFAITWLSVRTSWVRHLVTGEPQLLAFQGHYLRSPMQRTRVAESEILAAVRAAGFPSLDEVQAVVLETDGSLSVIRGEADPAPRLAGVPTPPTLDRANQPRSRT